MNMETIISDARGRLEALDFSAENARVQATADALAQIDQALATAQARHQEVLTLLRPLNRSEASAFGFPIGAGDSVANALLSGVNPTDAAAAVDDKAKLEHERDALKEGMSALVRRQQSLADSRRMLPGEIGRRILEELQPVCDALEAEAREAAKVIERAFAGLSAIGMATRANPRALQMTATALAALRGGANHGLLSGGDTAGVPPEIVDLLAILMTKGPAYKGGAPTTVQVRDPYAAGSLAMAMRGDRVPAR
jgi:hypothetical protein